MRKLVFASLVACMLALTSALSIASVSATSNENEPLRCHMEIDVYWTPTPPHWIGTITGDITGTIEFWEGPAKLVGNVDHFSETFIIKTSDGIITGYDLGLYNFNTFKFRANGWVTGAEPADGPLAYLVGYKFFEIGTTTTFIVGEPVHGTADMMLVAP